LKLEFDTSLLKKVGGERQWATDIVASFIMTIETTTDSSIFRISPKTSLSSWGKTRELMSSSAKIDGIDSTGTNFTLESSLRFEKERKQLVKV
jgi:hypothetical protein